MTTGWTNCEKHSLCPSLHCTSMRHVHVTVFPLTGRKTPSYLPTYLLFFLSVPCISLMLLLLLLSGAVSTAAFTLMMQCSQRASPHCRASHYSLLATAEVLGKLMFSVFVGAVTDAVGYPMAFGLFLTLSIIVLPLFTQAPLSLARRPDCKVETTTSNKNC